MEKQTEVKTEERIEFAKRFILLHSITDEDIKQDLYLAAIEFDCEEFSTKERKFSALNLVLEEVADDTDIKEEIHRHMEIPIGFMSDVELLFKSIFGNI